MNSYPSTYACTSIANAIDTDTETTLNELTVYNLKSIEKENLFVENSSGWLLRNQAASAWKAQSASASIVINNVKTTDVIYVNARRDGGSNSIIGITNGNIAYNYYLTDYYIVPATDGAVTITFNTGVALNTISVSSTLVPVAVAENKEFATFNSDYALDFTNVSGIIAYTAKVSADGSEVTMTKVEGKVPANTGLLIRKAQNVAKEVSADVPVVASAATVNNDFIAVTAANCDEGQEYKTVTEGFILATLNGVQDFYKANSTEGTKVAKGKAYLPATGTTASRMMMKFGEYTTGISEMRTVIVDNNVYNMNGVRVAQPQKGLYIVNGKKVVIK